MEKTVSSRGDISLSFFFINMYIRMYSVLYHSVITNYCYYLGISYMELTQMTSTEYLNYTSVKYAVAQK